MAKVFTPEEREKIKGQVVELVRLSGRETLRALEAKTGASRYYISTLARELVASGDVYNSGYGLFPFEQARKDWQNARKKLSRAKMKKPVVVDPNLIWLNRPGFPGECFICELRLPDHCFRWKHNKLFLLLPEEYGPAFPAIIDCYTSPPT